LSLFFVEDLGLLFVKEPMTAELSPKVKRALQFQQVAFGEDGPEILEHLKYNRTDFVCASYLQGL
jgi:hypothetical protein